MAYLLFVLRLATATAFALELLLFRFLVRHFFLIGHCSSPPLLISSCKYTNINYKKKPTKLCALFFSAATTAAGTDPVESLPTFLQCIAVQGIIYPISMPYVTDQSRRLQYPQMLGHRRLGHPQGLGDGVDAHRYDLEKFDDFDPLIHG